MPLIPSAFINFKEKKIKTIYTYDRLNRLTSEEQQEYNKGDLSSEFKDVYSFDDYNNILKKVHTENDTTKNSTVVSTYDKTRLLTQTETDSENNQSSQITYTYDDNGNMSSKALVKGENTTETQFSYDGFDRTTGIKIGGVTTSFDYNTDSDRVSKTTNGKTTESILDNGSVSADLIGETLKVFSDDNSVFCQNGVFSYNVINTKGDIIASDGSNGIAYNYNAYGTELYKYSSVNPIGYRNYYYDSETGLYYLKARYYDPTTGQFTQEDTVQDDNLQYNLYGYCSANPVLYTDADGHRIKIKGSRDTANLMIQYIQKIAGRPYLLNSTGGGFEVCHGNIRDIDRRPSEAEGKGAKLIWEILKSKRRVEINYNTKDSKADILNSPANAANGVGTNATINLSSIQKYIFTMKIENSKEIFKIQKTIPYISLAHELIHAYAIMKGIAMSSVPIDVNKYRSKIIKYFNNNSVKRKMSNVEKRIFSGFKANKKERINEMNIIGIWKNGVNGITENAIRRENRLLIRVSHYGAK